MSFTMVTSLNTYAKNMKMQMKWEQRRTNGDYSHDNTTSFARQLQQEAAGISGGLGVNGIGEPTGGSSHQSIMSGIRAKLNAGKKLSSSELSYLKKNDPETYQHVKAMEAERKAYEQRLRRCKTKEEVQRLKASQMASSLDRVRDVNNNPNIPDKNDKNQVNDEKASQTEDKNQVTDEKTSQTEDRNQVTDEKASQTEKEAAREAKTAEAASRTARASEATTISGNTYRRNVRQNAHAKPADAQIAKAKEIRRASQKTRVEAELTPEAQKVRRSRARSAYAQNMQSNEIAVSIDTKS